MLNMAFSEEYGLAGLIAAYKQDVFYLKRILKGWISRGFPGAWQGCVERQSCASSPKRCARTISASTGCSLTGTRTVLAGGSDGQRGLRP